MVDEVKVPADNQKEGLGGYQHMRRIVLAVLIVVLFAALLFGQSTFPPNTPMHESIEMFGVLLIFLGIVGRLWSTLYIGGRKSSEVVTGGPYSITRNPLYLFSTVAAAGVGAQIGSFSGIILFALLCAGAFHIVILREERYLKEVLGAPYAAYLSNVPRFFPNPRLYQEGDTDGFKPRLLLNTLLDGLVFLVALPAFELIDGMQQSGMLPVWFTLP
ncbi:MULTISPECIES: isoprenylcysteine carboxylmethyltransferase family protein [unclassified Mesorhizobium]|jgi:protein-S-isoprenylcysteine O-methyltransferase Ste14|uniref:methyltransferase family protein n=1 Tax=unclassified Mesorhizobium TaxID=325217 RepID=UPI000FE3C54B|nr:MULTISPECIES: isoprenylcysteine carboxylmethyltransferase family protein [unclassified Mesorhizobium]MDG4897109.1 isoprenylcysteine carboxylmethyltransferase family protein [Mesorhizobium sp. WSM4976]RWH69060.1 MAG: isoprenylcysteine carboxylmethyltransferase family protein [Mesorhizobium sp.]RWL26211.1 MAG: isoprenylcysteine carboxylmethyltransferase family protein [Mesorhizobium sp.]RWL26833.1 MAG: isoprenylcysteine carboxylmethyltransferase family protein [Mesorhizobium sp.]RWL37958.1 MA